MLARLTSEEAGSVLVETAFSVVLILLVSIPFVSILDYASQSAHDLAVVHGAVRQLTRSTELPSLGGVTFTCGATPTSASAPCSGTVERGSYVQAVRNTTVQFPFGLTLETGAKAVGRVG